MEYGAGQIFKWRMICFVSNSGWLDGSGMDGFRKCLEKEFTSIYVFNLRGNQRTSGELSRKEGGKGLLRFTYSNFNHVTCKKSQNKTEKAIIHYHDIGDYLRREENSNNK